MIPPRTFHRRKQSKRSHNHSPIVSSRQRRARIEQLESRWCPAVTFQLVDQTLIITGDELANAIEVVDRGNGNVDLLGDTLNESFQAVDQIVIQALAGDDQIEVALNPEDSILSMATLQVFSGAGHDVVTINGPATARGGVPGDILNVVLQQELDLGTGEDTLVISIQRFDTVDLDIAAAEGGDDIAVGLLLPAVQKVRLAAATINVDIEGVENSVNVVTRNYDAVSATIIGVAGASTIDDDSANEVGLSFLRVDPSDPNAPRFADQLAIDVQLGSSHDAVIINSLGFHALTSSVSLGDGENTAHMLHRVSGNGPNVAAVDAIFGAHDDVHSLALLGYDDITANVVTGDGADAITSLMQRNGRTGSGEVDLAIDSGASADKVITNIIGFHDVSLEATTGDDDDEMIASFLESFRRGRQLTDTSSLQLTIDLGAGDDRLTLLSRGYAQIDTSTDTGPAGDGNDTLTAIHLAAVGGFFQFPRLRRSVTPMDGDLDLSGIVTLGYASVEIETAETLQTAVIRD